MHCNNLDVCVCSYEKKKSARCFLVFYKIKIFSGKIDVENEIMLDDF
jgi:hypothetical protein